MSNTCPDRICFCSVFVLGFYSCENSVGMRISSEASENRHPHCVHDALLPSDGVKFYTVDLWGRRERREALLKCGLLLQRSAFLMTSTLQRQGISDQPIAEPVRISIHNTSLIPNGQQPNLCVLFLLKCAQRCTFGPCKKTIGIGIGSLAPWSVNSALQGPCWLSVVWGRAQCKTTSFQLFEVQPV